MAGSDDKFSHKKSCFLWLRNQTVSCWQSSVWCVVSTVSECVSEGQEQAGRQAGRQADSLMGLLPLIPWGISIETRGAAVLDHFPGQM